ncbi:hypothetical protein DFJ58DRAFT_768311 [Suillus subalutaceus]|uniref:uncharacterized protein n=1 Tax=Suillus subalutaceus TaxID=48586 RepID=UPI001B85D1BE|nr:uncharacterized protein DFJ58DRAFT_768311 [Suillus subalutaceus]KAG1867912.1 hypothetical protein DFJ58DRAFT_768311 [Suillus subalutaceus]
MSARLAKKIHPFILTKSRDIYPYLASKDSLDSVESLREDHGGAGSSTLAAPTLKKKKGPLRNINLADDSAKAALMEEWANLRKSQGTLLSSTSVGRDTTPHLSSNRGSQEPCNEASGEVAEPNKPHPVPANDHIEHTHPRPSSSLSNQVTEPLLDSDMPVTNESLFTPCAPAGGDNGNNSPGFACPCHGFSRGCEPAPPTTCYRQQNRDITFPKFSARASSAVDIELVVSSQADIEDVVLGFHMLDLHEVLSSWVPVSPTAPSIYVPPAVQHLIAAMNRQLDFECQARKRAEELYLDEMRKRIKMEEVVDRLQRERGQVEEQGASQQPPSSHASPRRASAHASPEEAGQQDGEAKPTST